jgi:hypothetical protein
LERIKRIIESNWRQTLLIILLLNFTLRLLIYCKTTLFHFSDYQVYLAGIDRIYNGGSIPILSGNFLFTISYLGYFAKYLLGSLNCFFVINCFLGTMTTLILVTLIIRLSGSVIAGMIAALIMTVYTEFMVFSSVFYTPVIMLFLLSLFIVLLYNYYRTNSLQVAILQGLAINMVFIISFLFKPELVFFPVFLGILAIVFVRKNKTFLFRNLFLALSLSMGFLLFIFTGIYSMGKQDVIGNDFVFFGHTDYGGDGGEGSFVYPRNKVRYEAAFSDYCKNNRIVVPTGKQRNNFQLLEIIKFIIQHPHKWVSLQFTKFFRTFGVVPETTSFKILYTGLLKGNLWLTSIVVVFPVAIIILLFILFFNVLSLKQLLNFSTLQLFNPSTPSILFPTLQAARPRNYFLFVYFLLFIYYIIATIFFGHYQERYRLPVMVVFIIPVLSYFIATFDRKQFFNRVSLSIKGGIIVLFLVVWAFQAKKAISNKERLNNAIESVNNTSLRFYYP